MKSRSILLAAVGVPLLVILGGCAATPPGGGAGVTVSGTAVAKNWPFQSDVTIAVTGGGLTFSTQVPVTNPQTSNQGWSFSIAGVSKGTYSVVVSFLTSYSGIGNLYAVNGGATQPVTSEGGATNPNGPETFTIEIDNVAIDGDTQIDLQLTTNIG